MQEPSVDSTTQTVDSTETVDSPTAPRADHEMDGAYQDEFTEERMSPPAAREDVAHSQQMDPGIEGDEQAGIPSSMPKAGGEPDFDDEVEADDDDDDEPAATSPAA